jgi:hypothetical protein
LVRDAHELDVPASLATTSATLVFVSASARVSEAFLRLVAACLMTSFNLDPNGNPRQWVMNTAISVGSWGVNFLLCGVDPAPWAGLLGFELCGMSHA